MYSSVVLWIDSVFDSSQRPSRRYGGRKQVRDRKEFSVNGSHCEVIARVQPTMYEPEVLFNGGTVSQLSIKQKPFNFAVTPARI